MKTAVSILLLTLTFILWLGGWSQTDLTTAVLSAIGTCLGAALAFRLQDDSVKRREEEVRVAVINKTLLVLTLQYNALANMKIDLDALDMSQAALSWMPKEYPEYHDLRIDLSSLSFLTVEAPQDVHVLLQISLEQENFVAARAALTERRNFYRDHIGPVISELQAAREALGLPGDQLLIADVRSALGKDRSATADLSINEVWQHVTESLTTLPKIHQKLREVAVSQYPRRKFLNLDTTAAP